MNTKLLTMGLAATSLFSAQVQAEGMDFDVSGKFATRVRNYADKTQAQQKIAIKLKLKLGGGWEVIGLAQNGSSANGGFDSFYDSSKDDSFDGGDNIVKNMKIRQAYIQNEIMDGVTVQAGSIGRDKGLRAMTSIDGNAWIEGARVKAIVDSLGEITVTGGSITDLKETGVGERDFDFNYIEVKIKKEVFDQLLVEAGYEKYDEDHFALMATKYQIATASEKIISVVSEALYDWEEGKVKASVGASFDLVEMITGNNSGVTMEIRHNYMSEGISDRATKLTGGFSSPKTAGKGHYATAKVSGKFNVGGSGTLAKIFENTGWHVRARHEYVTDETYYEAGVSKGF